MTSALWFRLFLCVVAVALAFAFIADPAHAQGSGYDKEAATKKGLDALATKEFDQKKMPGKFKIGLGVGSIFVMIAVVKWL